MEESTTSTVWDGRITGVRFGLATVQEICTSSNSDFPISHASQLANSFLGLPLECGKCESCGASEAGQCEGHFGYIELPIPVYHPSHLSELKRLLSVICLKCLKVKNRKFQAKNIGILERALSSCCEEASQISINEARTTEGACYLQLKLPSRSRVQEGFWNFLERYGYRYGDKLDRTLLPSEVMVILKKLPADTRRKLAAKGFFPQDGYIMQNLPVPPNCLSVPDISDGITVMSSDLSITMLKKILKKIEIIKSSRSGMPNFEAHQVEANDLQVAIAQYLDVRGTSKASRDLDARFGINKESNDSTKAWLEKMKTLFIRKGSGFSSRSVITGDAYKGVNEIGLPSEIAQRITFEERVTQYNMQYLQKLVDEKLCLTYRDGQSTYSLREGSKGHTFLRPGQVVHRRVMDGDIVFINRPPTTHKHSLQALAVYIHNDHTVKINPLICGPLSADFDGDCIHLFYPQSLTAKAEVVELFSVEKQLLSSHSGNLNLQLATDSLLSLKVLFKKYLLTRVPAQQLAMFLSNSLPEPALLKPQRLGHQWTASQIIQTALPRLFDCLGDKYIIRGSEILNIEFNRDTMQSSVNEILASIFHEKGPEEVLKFFNSLQPLLMENLFTEGFSVDLKDFYIPRAVIEDIQSRIQEISSLLFQMRRTYNELVQLQIDSHLRLLRLPIANFILSSSSVGDVIDSKSDSAISKVVQQVGFLGIQLSDKGKFYSKTLVGDMASLFKSNYPFRAIYPAEEFGLVTSCLFHGLDPYQEMVHSISAREVIVRSSRGLTEPGTLFKNLMAILRDVVICYDGTVRNVCSNAVIQFQYGITSGTRSLYAAGEPVGVLAATAMSNPAYKAVLDSSSSSNSSWEMMKEILLCPVTFKNDLPDRRVILYLNDCECGRKYCRENAAYVVKNLLKKVSLKDIAVDFSIEYSGQQILHEGSERDGNLLGHVHLNKLMFQDLHVSMLEVCEKVQDRIDSFLKKKGMKKNAVGQLFKRLKLSGSECCSFGKPCGTDMPCLTFCWQDISDLHVEETSQSLAHLVLPVLLETIITGDPRVCMANIIWIAPDTTTWIRNPSKNQKGELALDVVLEKDAVKQSGDAWRVVLDSCLPVIHLIDTSRSIPHAIKQVQELLGISCAFNQAVQRLSTSVSMVAKGVVKEHLILLANSMTCAGNLIGFNSGGIKALSRSLSVQVPFAEATLFTPKKCFEKAAEKCHVDSLASIVASCSWGKQVSVGTGCRFDVLWDTREVGKNRQDGIDVYNFLHLVRSSSKEEANTSACLGAEIDDLDLDYDNAEWGLSPEHSSDKPIFEDSFEFQNGLENPVGDLGKPDESIWVKGSSINAETSGKDWGVDKSENWGAGTSSSKPNGWSSWGTDAVRSENILPTGAPQARASVTWNSTNVESSKVETPSTENDSPGDLWGVGKKSEQNSLDTTTLTKPNGGPSSSSTWGVNTVQRDDVPPNNPWTSGKKDEPSADSGDGTKWSEGKKERDDVPPNNPWSSSKKDDVSADSGDGKKWFAGKKQISGDDTTLSKPSGWSDWGTNSAEDNSHETGKIVDSVDGKEWCTEKKQSSGDATTLSKPSGRSDWGTHSTENSLGTGKNVDSGDGREWFTGKKQNSGDGTALAKSSEWSSWGANSVQTDDESLATGQQKESPVNIWSPSQGGTNGQSPWGQPKRFSSNKEQNDSPRGWGSTGAGDWKAKASGNLTATRQRLDMFTSEEQDILLDVEPIMQAIRRIMHQTGCNDGDPLSADDQSYILENVFNHHPDKTTKMGVGINYVMVNKHSNFQDTRCLYVVLTDGHREDFSYRKCLENFVKCKYPDQAEAFNGKYFRKPRPPLNRERSVSVAPEEARADKIGSPLPPLNREDSVAPEEAGADKIESS